MATSEVTICNLALAHLGDEATVSSISPPEGSAEADHCSRFYPIARDALLCMHEWSFATRRDTSPALLTSETTVWQYAYAKPNLSLAIFGVLPKNSTNDYAGTFVDGVSNLYLPYVQIETSSGFMTQPYALEALTNGTEVIYTDVQDAEIRYAIKVTDTGKFPPLFVTALSHLLAAYLAGPVIKGTEGVKMAQMQYKMFTTLMNQAETHNANQSKANVVHTAPWMRNR